MQSSSKIFEYCSLRVALVLTQKRNGDRCKMLCRQPISILTDSFIICPLLFLTANSAGLFFMVTRKSQVKKLEVPFIKYLINSEVSLFFSWKGDDQETDSENTLTSSIWQFSTFPYTKAVRKEAKLQNKNLSFKWALLLPTESTSTFHLNNLLLLSRHHIHTNSVAPFFVQKPLHNAWDKILRGTFTFQFSLVQFYEKTYLFFWNNYKTFSHLE